MLVNRLLHLLPSKHYNSPFPFPQNTHLQTYAECNFLTAILPENHFVLLQFIIFVPEIPWPVIQPLFTKLSIISISPIPTVVSLGPFLVRSGSFWTPSVEICFCKFLSRGVQTHRFRQVHSYCSSDEPTQSCRAPPIKQSSTFPEACIRLVFTWNSILETPSFIFFSLLTVKSNASDVSCNLLALLKEVL